MKSMFLFAALCACTHSAAPAVVGEQSLSECRKACPAGTTAQVTGYLGASAYKWTCSCMDPVVVRATKESR